MSLCAAGRQSYYPIHVLIFAKGSDRLIHRFPYWFVCPSIAEVNNPGAPHSRAALCTLQRIAGPWGACQAAGMPWYSAGAR